MDFFQFASYAEIFVTTTFDASGQAINRTWISLLVGGLCFLIVYIFQAFGLYTIAKREGFKNRWMAFVPFFNTYYLGVCSEKNNVYGMKTKYFSLATAIVEALLVIGYIFYYVACFQVWEYLKWQPESQISGITYYTIAGFKDNMPSSLNWLGWIYLKGGTYILSWVELIFVIMKLLLLVSFFKTYAARQYLAFSIVGALLPLQGILIYVVRNNKGMNYMDYIRAVRERNYRMYQQQYGNPYNQNPYNQNPYNGNRQGEQQHSSAPDPFDETGNGSGSSSDSSGKGSSGSDSPFDEFN